MVSNKPYLYSRNKTGTRKQLRLTRGVFNIQIFLVIFPIVEPPFDASSSPNRGYKYDSILTTTANKTYTLLQPAHLLIIIMLTCQLCTLIIMHACQLLLEFSLTILTASFEHFHDRDWPTNIEFSPTDCNCNIDWEPTEYQLLRLKCSV